VVSVEVADRWGGTVAALLISVRELEEP